MWNKLFCCWDKHRIPFPTTEDFTAGTNKFGCAGAAGTNKFISAT